MVDINIDFMDIFIHTNDFAYYFYSEIPNVGMYRNNSWQNVFDLFTGGLVKVRKCE